MEIEIDDKLYKQFKVISDIVEKSPRKIIEQELRDAIFSLKGDLIQLFERYDMFKKWKKRIEEI